MRIVSLLPAATEIVCALGLRDRLVARSHECDFPADVSALPALTRARVDSSLPSERLDAEVRRIVASGLPIYTLDEARLASLAPDVVVTQGACEVCAVSYRQVAVSLEHAASKARILSLEPTRLGHIFGDIRSVAAACGVQERGESVVRGLEERLARIADSSRGGRGKRVAVLEWLSPPMLAGHWVPEAVEAAGAQAVGPLAGVASPYTTWDAVGGLSLDALIVAPCGFDLGRTIAESRPYVATLRTLAPRVLLLDGNAYLNRPGPRIVDAVETIAAWVEGGAVPGNRGVGLEVVAAGAAL
jgi:iron complex transport system substrate-binding protein